MFETQISRIPILPFGMVNAHVIRGEAGCILVDTGIPGSEKKISRVLQLVEKKDHPLLWPQFLETSLPFLEDGQNPLMGLGIAERRHHFIAEVEPFGPGNLLPGPGKYFRSAFCPLQAGAVSDL